MATDQGSTPQSLREPDSEKTSPNLVRSPTETTTDDPESDPDYKRAKQFDDFLQGRLEEKETDWDDMFATIRCNRCG